MKIKIKDFIEIDFTARTESGVVFDTTIEADAKKANLPEGDYKPIQICIGEGHILKGLDTNLEGKEIGKEYEFSLEPENAFGKRDPKLIRIIPIKIFREKDVHPYPGLSLAIDDMVATIRAVSGGRVITDFNHPLAGKKLIYKVIIRKKLENNEDKIKVLLQKYLRTDKFSIKEKEIFLEGKFPEGLIKEAEKKIRDLIGDFTVKSQDKHDKLSEKEKSGEKDQKEQD